MTCARLLLLADAGLAHGRGLGRQLQGVVRGGCLHRSPVAGPLPPTPVDTEPKVGRPYAPVPRYDGVILGDWSSHTLRLIR